MEDRELPWALEAEQSVIGAILLKGNLEDADHLDPSKFFDARHNHIFGAMQNLGEAGEPIDLVTVTGRLQDDKRLEQAGGVYYLSQLARAVPTTKNLKSYADIVQDRYLQRQTIESLQRQLDAAWSADNATSMIAAMQMAATGLSDQAVSDQEMRTIKQLAMEAFEDVENRFASFADEVTGVPSGFIDLDRMTSGFQKADLIIAAARPSVGKTAFALNVVKAAATRNNSNVAVFSLEMPNMQLVKRMLSAEGNIDATKLRTGFLQEGDWHNLTMAIGNLSETNIWFADSSAMTAHEICNKSRRLKKNQGLDLIVIDYLQLIAGVGGGRKYENRQQEVSTITRMLKMLARELDVPIIVLSQLSRGVEQRQDKRPMLSDLRESGAIEQDADIVAFLYRDDYYDRESEKKNIIEIIIAKHRNGQLGTVELAFLKQYNKFLTLDRSDEPSDGRPIPDMYRGA